jgi:hypothetical protein
MMQTVSVTIDIRPQDIPTIVCSDYAVNERKDAYASEIAQAIAQSLGVEEFLHRPDRITELQRTLWQRDPAF